MINIMKKIISEVPILYKLYYYIIFRFKNKNYPQFFTNETICYFDGYPRSGNTFLSHFLINMYPDQHFVHHLHKVAPIKIALKKNIPIYIILRKPQECITSLYIKRYDFKNKQIPNNPKSNVLNQRAKEYLHYYSYILHNFHKINLILFEDLISKTEDSIYQISRDLGDKRPEQQIKDQIKRLSKKDFGAKSELGRDKPTKRKEIEKDKLKDKLNDDLIQSCNKLYNNLKKLVKESN